KTSYLHGSIKLLLGDPARGMAGAFRMRKRRRGPRLKSASLPKSVHVIKPWERQEQTFDVCKSSARRRRPFWYQLGWGLPDWTTSNLGCVSRVAARTEEAPCCERFKVVNIKIRPLDIWHFNNSYIKGRFSFSPSRARVTFFNHDPEKWPRRAQTTS